MSQVKMTTAERIQSLRGFGYTDRGAAFLCLTALHGGYFLRRQFTAYLGREDGGTVAQLVDRALSLEHARAFTYHPKVQLYHLYARPFYEAIGQGDNRNRRGRQPLTIKNKLMGLDFILAHPACQYLSTEQEKLDYFRETHQIPQSRLPAKLYRGSEGGSATARYFVDKYPIFIAATAPTDAASVVSFCFVDEGMVGLSRFDTYLLQYGPLFRLLPQFQLVFVAARPRLFKAAEGRFERFLTQGAADSPVVGSSAKLQRLLEYFEARRLFEAQQLASFDRAKLLRLRDDREAFSGSEYEGLYERWKSAGDRAVLDALATDSVARGRTCATFSTYLLEHDYDIFGSLTAF
jgi:hypothetical protein